MSRKAQKEESDYQLESSLIGQDDGIYNKISFQTRISLIKLVFREKVSIKRAASLLKLKISTAKSIVNQFAQEGRIKRKKYQKNLTIPEDLLHEIKEQAFKMKIKRGERRAKKENKKKTSLQQIQVLESRAGEEDCYQILFLIFDQTFIEPSPDFYLLLFLI